MGLVYFGVPSELVLICRQKFGIDTFIETGTFRGDTAAFAAQYFSRVYTVELDLQRYFQVVERFRNNSRIVCMQGHSPVALRAILDEVGNKPVMIWLDAHWCADAASYVEGNQCQVLQELEVINSSKADAFILVDDARLFLTPPPPPNDPAQWPALPELSPALSNGGTRIVTAVDDVLMAFPKRAAAFQREWGNSRPRAWENAPRR